MAASAFVTRAFLYGDGGGFFVVLRDFLYRMGFRETTTIDDPGDLTDHIGKGIWPIVFIEGRENDLQDGFSLFDNFYSNMGYELFPFILVSPSDDKRFVAFSRSLGARGFVRKPLQPAEAHRFIQDLTPNPSDPWVLRALDVAKMTMMGNLEGAQSILEKLAENPFFEKAAEVALLRCEAATGQFSKAEDRVVKLLKRYPEDLRMHLEAADYYKKTSQHFLALQYLKKVGQAKLLIHRAWEQVCLSLEVDEIDSAAVILNELYTKNPGLKDAAMEGISRMMLFMGLTEYLPGLLKDHPHIARSFANYVVKTRRIPV